MSNNVQADDIMKMVMDIKQARAKSLSRANSPSAGYYMLCVGENHL